MAYVNIKEKSDLVNIRKILQKRFLNEKLGEQDIYQENTKQYKPLIESLKDITTHQKEILQSQSAIPAITMSRTPLAIEDVPASPSTPGYNLGKISEKYLKGIFSHGKYDKAFGIKAIEGSTDFKLGNKIVKIDGNNLIIDGHQYIGTEGLWKLLTLKKPGEVSSNDYNNYKKIMLQTKAFLKDDGSSVKANKGDKYDLFVKPIYTEYKLLEDIKKTASELRQKARTPRRSSIENIPRRASVGDTPNISGTGFKFLPSDPDELVNRHRILFSEIKSGNTNVFNELQAINDELLRLRIFDKDLIESLNNFFLYNK